MTTTFDLERRLRLPAPDEPAVLPPLLLPTDTASVGRSATRWRLPLLDLRGGGLAYLVVLLLLLAAVLVVGALRQRQAELTPLGLACQPDQGPVIGVNCASVAIPEGWTTLASGQIMPGDFTEVGLGYEIVDLVIASVPLGDCPTTPGPFPTAIPAGTNAFEVPVPTPDPGLACLRDVPLPPNAVRIETMRGTRIVGRDQGGGGIPDTTEPTAENGWTEVVDDRPAKLTVIEGTGGSGEPAETRTWDIIVPGSIDQVIRIRADFAGPDLGAGRATAQAFVDSLTFGYTRPSLDDGAVVLRKLLDQLERAAREQRSDFYACFPRTPGRADATISGGPSGLLADSLDVTCSTELARSETGVWRIVLDVSWDATDTYDADTIRTEFFSTGQTYAGSDSLDFNGGYMTSLAGRPMPDQGTEGWFPGGQHQLPPPLTGPLNLPPGSLAEILAPGEAPGPLGEMSGGSYPGIVGTHLYVLDGPELVDGDEWYRVQGTSSDMFSEIAWIRGTRDGRPQLAIVEPSCPAESPTVGDVTWLIPAERLSCFGGRELTFEGAVIERDDQDVVMCSTGDGDIEPCSGGQPDWLTAFTPWQLYGADGPAGPYPPLPVWLHPSVAVPPGGVPIQIVGRFDHPEAPGCRWPEDGSAGPIFNDPAFEELLCRQRFVITGFEPR